MPLPVKLKLPMVERVTPRNTASVTTDRQEMADRWLLGWRGLVVTDVDSRGDTPVVRFGDAASLTLGQDAPATVAASLTAQRVPASHSALQSLTGSDVLSAVAFKDGTLRLILGGGRRLDIASVATGLAWSACSDDFICRSVGGALITSLDS